MFFGVHWLTTNPAEEKEGNEEIPFSQVEWVAGFDWTPGALRITAEYSGKKVLDFYEAPYDPIIGTTSTWKS